MRLVVRNGAFLVYDLIGWALIPAFALALRLDGFGPELPYLVTLSRLHADRGWPSNMFAMWRLGLYRRYWRYASVEELALIVLAMALGCIGTLAVYAWIAQPFLGRQPDLPGRSRS